MIEAMENGNYESLITGSEVSEKQANFLENSYAKVNIASGAIQAGKSYILNERFAKYITFESPHANFHITGNTIDTIDRNVINNNDYGLKHILEDLLGKKNVKYAYGDRLTIWLPDGERKICYIIGINDKRAVHRLKGSPAGGTLADEITTYPEEAGNMMFARNSLRNSLTFASTNPDTPGHWVWKQWLANQEKINQNQVKAWMFTLDDNPTMDEMTKKAYYTNYAGVFFQRNILGLWVMAEGAVYNMFDTEIGHNVINQTPELVFDDAYITVDYGTSNVTTAGLWFVKWNKGSGNHYYYCHDEFYYNAKDEENNGKRLRDEEVVEEIYKIYKPYSYIINNIFVDPSATSLIEELTEFEIFDPELRTYVKPFANTFPAYNNVIEGISKLTTLISHSLMQFHERCKNSIREFQSYVWDEKKDDVPVKKDDHTCDTARYGVMSYLKLLNDPGNQDDHFTVAPATVNMSDILAKNNARKVI